MSDEDDIEELEDQEEPAEYEAAKEKLRQRCDAARIKHADELGFDEESKILVVNMPCGRDTFRVSIDRTQEAERLLSIPFEKYCMLGEYVGVCSYSDGTIEASVRSVGSGAPAAFLMRRLLSHSKSSEDETETITPLDILQEDVADGLALKLGPPSADFSIFQSLCPGWRTPFTLTLSKAGVRTHDKALRLIERVAHSLFFNISLSHGFALSLQREVRGRRNLSGARRGIPEKPTFPKREYRRYCAQSRHIDRVFPGCCTADVIRGTRFGINCCRDPNCTPVSRHSLCECV